MPDHIELFRLLKILVRLTEQQREVVLLRTEGKTYSEVGKVLGMGRERPRQIAFKAHLRACKFVIWPGLGDIKITKEKELT